jgi:hypothetical protein
MNPLRFRAVAVLAALPACAWASLGSAAPCGRPDVDATFPRTDATRVPPNAQLSAHYASPALYDDEPVNLLDANGAEVAISVVWDEADSMLRARPSSELSAGYYELAWPGLRSLTGAGVGRGRTISFFVSSELDSAPPVFRGLSEIDWDLSRDRDPCLDRLADRFSFTLSLGEADDDAGTDLLAVQVFETQDPADDDDVEPARVALRAWPDDGKLELRRPADEAGRTCFAAVVQDLVGNVSGGGEREVCVKTKKPPFFDGCTFASPRAESRPWAMLVLALGALGRRRGARRAPRSRA